MSRELLLLRHGKSDWRLEIEDFHRPLRKRGKKAAGVIGEWLFQQQLIPDWIVSSPAERALKTAEKAAKALGLKKSAVHVDERIYEASVPVLKQVLADCPGFAQRVLLVGHNPALEALAMELAAELEMPEDGKLMPTATLVQIQLPDDWSELSEASGELIQHIRARDLQAAAAATEDDSSGDE